MKKCENLGCKKYITPLAIIFGCIIIAGAIYMSHNTNTEVLEKKEVKKETKKEKEEFKKTDYVRKVDDKDHVKGAKDAKVTIIEYTDFECPYCKKFHNTMKEVLSEESDVKLIFRQFPLDSLHPKNARKAAEASECVDKLGGNEAFWKFANEYFSTTKTNDRWNIDDELEKIVKISGVDKSEFDKCYLNNEFKDKVQKDVDNAIKTGGRGTPWSILITKSGKTIPINGAFSKEKIKQMIEFGRNN